LAKAFLRWSRDFVAENSDPRELHGLLRKRSEGRGEKATRERADEIAPVNH